MKLNKYLNEKTKKRYFITDNNHNRIGLVHHIYKGDKSIDVDADVDYEHHKQIVEEFEKLENEVYDFIDKKQKEFDLFLEKNNFHSGMGSIGYNTQNKEK